MEKEVGSREKKALTQKEKDFILDYLTKRNAPGTTFGNAEVKEFSQKLKGVEGIERSEGAVYMHLKRLSMPKLEPEEATAARNKTIFRKA